eukprot:5166554-Alexandrium_andersonii.AAC.1
MVPTTIGDDRGGPGQGSNEPAAGTPSAVGSAIGGGGGGAAAGANAPDAAAGDEEARDPIHYV